VSRATRDLPGSTHPTFHSSGNIFRPRLPWLFRSNWRPNETRHHHWSKSGCGKRPIRFCGGDDGRTPEEPVTFARVGTDDVNGCIRASVGEGRFTGDPLATFRSRAVVEVPRLQAPMRLYLQERIRNTMDSNTTPKAFTPSRVLRTAFGTRA
jgi:hypothetical protein